MKRLLVLALICVPMAFPELLDRIAITIDHDVITEQQVDEEIRVTALLNSVSVKRDKETRRSAGDRLVDQSLVQREMSISHYPMPDKDEVQKMFDQVKAQQGQGSIAEVLRRYKLTESILKGHLTQQLMTMRFVQYRFRPNVDVDAKEIQGLYARRVKEWKQQHGEAPPPTFEKSRQALEEELKEEQINFDLQAWLDETRKQSNILYLDSELQ